MSVFLNPVLGDGPTVHGFVPALLPAYLYQEFSAPDWLGAERAEK